MHLLSETNILIFLIQLFVLTLCTRGLGELFTRWNQPALTAEILVGIILGPTLFGRYFPELHGMLFPADVTQQNMLETVAWIGVLFLLLDTGLEIDFSVAWRHRGNALVIALAHIIIPMLIAFLPCYFLPDHFLPNPDRRLLFALFMAAVMAICAMPVAARVLHDLKLLKTDLGFLTMSALAVNDLIGWMDAVHHHPRAVHQKFLFTRTDYRRCPHHRLLHRHDAPLRSLALHANPRLFQ